MDKMCFTCGIEPRAITNKGKSKSYCRGCATLKELARHKEQHEAYVAYLKAYRARPEFLAQKEKYLANRKLKTDGK